MNLSGPPDKAKYSLATDSELVPRGKGGYRDWEKDILFSVADVFIMTSRASELVP